MANTIWDIHSTKLQSMAAASISPEIRILSKAPNEIENYGQLDEWIDENRHQTIWLGEAWDNLLTCIDAEYLLYVQNLPECRRVIAYNRRIAVNHASEAQECTDPSSEGDCDG